MNRLLCLLLALVVAAGATACSRNTAATPPAGVSVAVAVAPDPPTVGPATMTVTLTDQGGAAITGAGIRIKADMAHAGMTPVLATLAPAGAAGIYTAPFEWTMGGDWIVTFDITLADGRSFTQTADFSVRSGK